MNERFTPNPEDPEESADEIHPGEALLRKIGNLPENYHTSAIQKLLFATVTEADDQSGFPVASSDSARFTALGLEYNGKRYPYLDKYRRVAHNAIVQSYCVGAPDLDTLESHLASANAAWESPIGEAYRLESIPLVQKNFKDNLRRREIERKEIFGNEPLSTSVILEIATRENAMSTESAEFCKNYTKIYNSLKYSFKNRVSGQFPITDPTLSEQAIHSAAKSYAEQMATALKKYTDAIGLETAYDVNAKPNGYPWLGAEIAESIIGRTDLKESKVNESLDIRADATKEKQKLLHRLSKYGITEDRKTMDILSKIESLSQRYYKEILPEYLIVKEKIANREQAKHHKFADETRRIIDSGDEYLDKHTAEIAYAKILDFKKRVAGISPLDGNVKDVYFFPTGAIIETDDRRFYNLGISPLNNRIVNMLDSDIAAKAWVANWESRQSEYDSVVRSTIVQSLIPDKASAVDSFDQKLATFSARYQLDLPAPFDSKTGKILESVQPHDLEVLEDIVPALDKFIYGVSLYSDRKDISLKSTRLEVLGFLSGDSNPLDSTLFTSDRKIKIRALEELIENTETGKSDKLAARVVAEVGMATFNNLSPEARKNFSDLLGPRAKISRTDFYRVYRRSITDANMRRNLAERTFFLQEFIKYLKGNSSDVMPQFFTKIEKKPALEP